ncbi:hypothetical protein CSC00_5862 (plasmid) [Klebsiella pneumoniae]|nr:hypothetical protein CSC00_5862 [Klebsiella pneumoniae]
MAFFQGTEVVALDGREMYEHVFAAVCWGNKTEAFISVKPFY